jgi:protein gp37
MTRIDWPFSPFDVFNPVVGCKHGCIFCYAKRMNTRFKFIPVWENPVFFWDKLQKPYKTKKPTTYFVGSMCDLFGEWIIDDWIKQVITVCQDNPLHAFLFLTKNPRRYLQFDFPDNVMLGVTITHFSLKADVDRRIMQDVSKSNRTFASIEPIMSGFNANGYIMFKTFELLIVGAMTGPEAVRPKKEWIESIKHPNIYYKANIRKLFPELKNNIYELQRSPADSK